jgi:hypothetical protein
MTVCVFEAIFVSYINNQGSKRYKRRNVHPFFNLWRLAEDLDVAVC